MEKTCDLPPDGERKTFCTYPGMSNPSTGLATQKKCDNDEVDAHFMHVVPGVIFPKWGVLGESGGNK